jgi:hypothetical protein
MPIFDSGVSGEMEEWKEILCLSVRDPSGDCSNAVVSSSETEEANGLVLPK